MTQPQHPRPNAAPGRTGWANRVARRFRRLSLLKKTMIANFAVVLLGAVVGTYLTRSLADRHSGLTLALLFSTCGALTTIFVNYLAFWDHFRPLLELNRALEAIRMGREARHAVEGMRAAGIGGELANVRALLERIEDESFQFSARLLGSIESERQRIGRELHDDTSQTLAAALLKLDLVDRQLGPQATAARASLTSARELVEQTLDQLKAVIYDLRPAMLDDLGLVAALRWYAKARADKPGLEVVTSFDVGSGRLPSHVETAMYRVGQEALANAVKYAEATKIELSLEVKPGYAALRVFDNGKGFDLANARGRGIGIMSMRERVGLLDGKLNIVTEPGEGTRVYVVVPLSSGIAEETAPA